jgi:hypothetical protein
MKKDIRFNKNKLIRLFYFGFIGLFLLLPKMLIAQPFVYKNERGDTVVIQWMYDEHSNYVKDELIIDFREEALNKWRLCESFKIADGLDSNSTQEERNKIISFLYSEKLPLDTVIKSSELFKMFQKYGGMYLQRITVANPCKDTISITRYGDTIKIDFYLTMVLKLNNNHSVMKVLKELDKNFSDLISYSQPNYIGGENLPRIDWVKIYYSYSDNTIKVYLINNGREKFKIEIYNYLGELVFEQNNYCYHMDIDASSFHYGVYIVKYISDDYTTTQLINIFR